MTPKTDSSRISLSTENRYDRLEKIEWWDPSIIRSAKVLVVGAGALGNEILKNFALLGLRNAVVIDMDHIEKSNLTRSVLFRESDEGQPKSQCAVKMMKQICPDVHAHALTGNVLSDMGLGYFKWADVVVGALDNREARIFVNSACAMTQTPWIDGGIDVLQGIVRGFFPPETACYECTMSKADWTIVNQRRSCSMLARRALANHGTPTTPTIASIIGGIQAQEVIKILHGMDALLGKGFVFDGLSHTSYPVEYQLHPDCYFHDPGPPVISDERFTSDTPLGHIAGFAETRLGGLTAVDFNHEIIRELTCPKCRAVQEIWAPESHIDDSQISCRHCGHECIPVFLHSLEAASRFMDKTPSQLGLPTWDILWFRFGRQTVGIEIAGDKPDHLS